MMDWIRTRRAGLVALLVATVVAACSGPAADTPPDGYAKDVLVDTEWVEANAQDPAVRLVEVGGNDRAFLEGHLPGAAFLATRGLTNPDVPVPNTIATRAQLSAALSAIGLERDQTIVLYDGQRSLQAARAYWVLKYYGHEDIRIYDGGGPRWVADGREMSAEVVAFAPSDYRAGPADPEMQTTWQYVVDHVDDPSTLQCDVRSPEEFLGRDVRSDRGGHVPGAVNVEWTAAVHEDGTFKSALELWTLYRGAGFTADKNIITYCQTGIRGAHTWFVLSELLGYPSVRNYDGSWAEYGNNPESPVEI